MERAFFEKKIYSKIDELPTLPSVLPKLLNLIEDDKSTSSDIVNTISHDPALTSKILKVANSAYYGFPQGISDLDRAVALLGFNMVKSLALSLGVMQNISSEKSTERFSENDLWFHSVVVATALKELSKRFGEKENSDFRFIIGLLHDIGIIILDQFFSDQFQEVLDELNKVERGSLHIVEKNVLGIDHGEIGAMLLERWQFPPEVRYPIAVHHQQKVPEGINAYDVSMLRVADMLSYEIDSKKGNGNPELPSIDEKDLMLLKMDGQDLEGMKAYLNEKKEAINTFFNAVI